LLRQRWRREVAVKWQEEEEEEEEEAEEEEEGEEEEEEQGLLRVGAAA
jgi:hypothetical protein